MPSPSTDDLGPCLEWQGVRTNGGYGRMGRLLLHRAVWANANGPIPDGMVIMHRCDNPPCYRLSHLLLGTHRDNAADKMAKGRGVNARGERNGKSKLTEEQVVAIRSDQRSQSKIALAYSVSENAINAIKRHLTWAHLP